MFKIRKETLKFALGLCSKVLAPRQAEEIVYRSLRLKSFIYENNAYLAFSANGGYNAVSIPGMPLEEMGDPIDILVEAEKLVSIIDKASVDFILVEVIDGEIVLISANGENKLRYLNGEAIPLLPIYSNEESNKVGSLLLKDFNSYCKLAVPFVTVDVHNELVMGLCIEHGKMFATDEKKGVVLEEIGIDCNKIAFNPLAAEIVKDLDVEETVNFYLGGADGAEEPTHLVLEVNGIEIFVLKYKSHFPTVEILSVKDRCNRENTNTFVVGRLTTLQALGRVGVFLDQNDLLGITPGNGGILLETMDARTGELGKEFVESDINVEEELLDVKIFVSFNNFRILLEALNVDVVEFFFSSNSQTMSIVSDNNFFFLTKKKVN